MEFQHLKYAESPDTHVTVRTGNKGRKSQPAQSREFINGAASRGKKQSPYAQDLSYNNEASISENHQVHSV